MSVFSGVSQPNHHRELTLTLGAWNVCTLMDDIRAERPEWRTTLIPRELAIYNVQIAPLSETWLAEEDQLSEIDAGYTFFFMGCKRHEWCDDGDGIAIKSNLVNKLSGLSWNVNDCLMTVQLPLLGRWYATLVSAYAPTMTHPDSAKKWVCQDLKSTTAAVPSINNFIILSDFNERVGTVSASWEGVY